MSIIIDRRLNDRKKSAVNRQRFLRRYKKQIRRSLSDVVAKRSITDMEHGGDVRIPSKDIREPSFHHGQGGDRDIIHPGNKEFTPGDKIKRPQGGKGEGSGQGDPSDSGEGSDEFMFTLSREEFMNLFFDDLELPRLARNALGDIREPKWERAGHKPSGTPMTLEVVRSLRNAMARRIAIGAPLRREIEELEAEGAPQADIDALKERLERIPYLDEFDLRFRNRTQVMKPVSRAAMFCLMDVSASMDETKKDLAKRFFTLLYLFLSRKYEHVDVVFIRHTSDAEEVDEETFFYDRKTGGTIVYSALKLMHEIIEDRYPTDSWNLYGAQVSDGDAFGADTEKSRAMLQNTLLPLLRYFAYVEVPDSDERATPLSSVYKQIHDPRFAMRCVTSRTDVYPVLRDLFTQESA